MSHLDPQCDPHQKPESAGGPEVSLPLDAPFKCLPIPPEEAVQQVLTKMRLQALGEVQLVAEVSTRLLIPVVTVVAGASGKNSTRYATLLAEDGIVVVRPLSKALPLLHEGWVPTQAQAYARARRRLGDPEQPLAHLKHTDRVPAHCMAELSTTCRHDHPITVERSRQLIRAGLAFQDDQQVIQRICGECCRKEAMAVATAQAKLATQAAEATNPRGISHFPCPPGLEALRAKLPAYDGLGLDGLLPQGPRPEPPGLPPASALPSSRKKGTANWNERVWQGAWSPGMAYALGVIAGDGTIQPNRVVIELDARDRDVLAAVCRAVKADPARICPVKRSTPGEPGKSVALSLSSPVATPALLHRLGLTAPGPKDAAINVPPGLPDAYLPDFLRGLIDTDGTVTRCGTNTPQLALYSNAPQLLQNLRQRVGAALGLPGLGFIWAPKNPSDAPGTRNQMWVITGHQARLLAHWLWPDDRPWIGGKRKAQLAADLLKGLTLARRPKIKTFRVGKAREED
ncbi:MAG: hypothetical protein H6Q00_1588 [Holophagaceae bacterium]|nr:hypothetical protein [Holophagaceae bacterium]